MTKAKIQPTCRAHNFNVGYFDGTRVFPRSVTDRNNALFLRSNHFCLIWKSEGNSFIEAIKESKDNFKIVDNSITEQNFNSHSKYDFIPKRNESHLTNFIVYDLETHFTDRTRPYNITLYRLSKIAGRYNRDLTREEIEKCKEDTLVLDGDKCVSNALDFLFKFKAEPRKTIDKKC